MGKCKRSSWASRLVCKYCLNSTIAAGSIDCIARHIFSFSLLKTFWNLPSIFCKIAVATVELWACSSSSLSPSFSQSPTCTLSTNCFSRVVNCYSSCFISFLCSCSKYMNSSCLRAASICQSFVASHQMATLLWHGCKGFETLFQTPPRQMQSQLLWHCFQGKEVGSKCDCTGLLSVSLFFLHFEFLLLSFLEILLFKPCLKFLLTHSGKLLFRFRDCIKSHIQ